MVILYEVGFASPEFTVSESDGSVDISIGLISGKLRNEMEVTVSTFGSDAVGKAIYNVTNI